MHGLPLSVARAARFSSKIIFTISPATLKHYVTLFTADYTSFGILLDRSRLSGAPPVSYVGQQVRYIDAKNERFPALRRAVAAS
jgi:hypothetical protein